MNSETGETPVITASKAGEATPDIQAMKLVCQQWKIDANGRQVLSGSLYNRFLLRPVSIYVTRMCVTRGVSANAATMIMTIMGVMGCALCLPHSVVATVAAGVCFALFDLFDAVDGEIARWKKTSNTRGLFLDQLSHVLVDYPSRGLAALHLFLWTDNVLYLGLAAAATGSSLLGRTVREIGFRINAESHATLDRDQHSQSASLDEKSSSFCCPARWKAAFTATHPLVKARLVHIATVVALILAYCGPSQPLIGLSWFYAAYCVLWVALEIPYYYKFRVVDTPHSKPVHDYRWPI